MSNKEVGAEAIMIITSTVNKITAECLVKCSAISNNVAPGND